MDEQKKLDTNTGNGQSTATPILASESANTAAKSQPSPKSTSIAAGSTKPLSIQEALSLLQTLCRDLSKMGVKVAFMPTPNRLFIGLDAASIGVIGTADGHITLDGVPVSKDAK